MTKRPTDVPERASDPLWYKDAVMYELHVRAFYDSNDDGIGDLRGLKEKLDYLQDLGVTALWLLPFYPSPLRDDGYDIADYTGFHPDYGTKRQFKALLREAHRRGLRVVTELVLNHTSDQHPWFQQARRAPAGSRTRDLYVWSDTPERYPDARIIFQDFETSNWTWDPVAGAYYWHRFYSHQPDLNYDSPEVRRRMLKVVDHWLDMGIDGLRLDAVPYLFEREGTDGENLPETHDFLRVLRAHVDAEYADRLLLAEANQWPEDAAAYFGAGNECHMAFHFPIMPRLFMAIRLENHFPIVDILDQTPSIPEGCQWALFLRNHDELTLEMVTDEERDYMYRVYAHDPQARINLGIRHRLAPLLENDRRKIELMNGLLLSLPGTPVIYYGDEIGMGDNIYLGDRNAVRTPMHWSADRNAGFSRANPQKLHLPVIIDPEYHFEAVNVEAQQNNPTSLLWWMKHLIALRKSLAALARGELEMLQPENAKILAFIRRYGDEMVLVVANLSRFVQTAELDLSEHRGAVPVEVFGQTRFPPIGDDDLFLTLGPYAFYWFSLERAPTRREPELALSAPIALGGSAWDDVLRGRSKAALEERLPRYLRTTRWFGGKAQRIRGVHLREAVPIPVGVEAVHLSFADVEYLADEPETYLLALAYAEGERAETIEQELPGAPIARLRRKGVGREGLVYDAVGEKAFSEALLKVLLRRRRLKGRHGGLSVLRTAELKRLCDGAASLEPSALRAEQSNTSIVYGDRLILKLIRRLEPGRNPDLELGRRLTDLGFDHVPPLAGALEYESSRPEEPMTVGLLQGFVTNQGDAWQYTLDHLSRYFERALSAGPSATDSATVPDVPFADLAERDVPTLAAETIGAYLQSAELLGRRTAELHLALAVDTGDPVFRPEPLTHLGQRSIYQSIRSLIRQTFRLLRAQQGELIDTARPEAAYVIGLEREILKQARTVLGGRIEAKRIRCHGDYHLGQVLFTGNDFIIIDFEGEPLRPLSERKLKRSPLRDVAGMLRSFHYAAYASLFGHQGQGLVAPESVPVWERWAEFWTAWVGAAFLRAYFASAGEAALVPADPDDLDALLFAFLLEKAVYELGYELNSRPEWVRIPLRGIARLMAPRTEGEGNTSRRG